jgi:hypothetical protein
MRIVAEPEEYPEVSIEIVYLPAVLVRQGQTSMRQLSRIPARKDVLPNPPRLMQGRKLFVIKPASSAVYNKYNAEMLPRKTARSRSPDFDWYVEFWVPVLQEKHRPEAITKRSAKTSKRSCADQITGDHRRGTTGAGDQRGQPVGRLDMAGDVHDRGIEDIGV